MAGPIKIVLTGGPRGGKSTAEKRIKNCILEAGSYPVFIPETATRIIMQYGINPPKLQKTDPEKYFEFQLAIIKTQLHEEEAALHQAVHFSNGKRIVLVCDRGIPDSSAYMAPSEYKRALDVVGLNRVSARDARYDAVFHLVTAADGAETHYSLENNEARYEDPEMARVADKRTQLAWLGHPHQRIIDNSTDFEGKMNRLTAKMLRAIGVPERIETERKFLVHQCPDPKNFPVPVQPIEIHQNYLIGEGQLRFRQRSQEGEGTAYYLTQKIPTANTGSNIELENTVSSKGSSKYFQQFDPDYDLIYKYRHYFIWNHQVFELDRFHFPKRHNGLVMLEIELDDENDKVEIPEWLGPVTEVTGDPEYKNINLAKRP